ncbi:hypothetical protein ACQI4F_08870 [Mycolicibacterium vaccae]|uniref:hypothetical protein n=1 Tax=Mycolicibacterium vaccae TaxID=1810 RepID=UPI003CF224A8
MKLHTAPSPTTLVDGKAYVLGGTVEHENRISWIPPDTKGSAALNAFVLKEGNRGLMIDTSMPVMGDAIVRQLQDLELDSLTILMTRPVEFDSMGNTEHLLRNFKVDTVYAELMFPPQDWTTFRDEGGVPEFEARVYKKNTTIEPIPGRPVELVDARLKLLACAWVFDPATGILFTSDAFSHGMAPQPGVQVLTAENDATTAEDVKAQLLTKYDWLAAAFTDPLRTFLADVFANHDVTAIAPTIGCVLQGRDTVKRHYELIDTALGQLKEMEDIL